MTHTAAEPDGEAVLAGLTDDIGRLAVGETLTIAEFCREHVAIWRIRMNSCGIPRVRYETRPWESFRSAGTVDVAALIAHIRPMDETLLVVARTGPADGALPGDLEADHAYHLARNAYAPQRAFRSAACVDDLLDESTARVPLPPSIWYELVLLRRHQSGRLELTTQQLFLPEATRGETRTFTVRCEPGGNSGTVFAVVARDAAFEYQVLSLKSAPIPAGSYIVTATLHRPGGVSFRGLPSALRDDPRNWLDLLAEVPGRLDATPPAHLILALETCGSEAGLKARVDRVRQLVSEVVAAPNATVRLSVCCYAAHLHERGTRDEPVRVLAWATDDPQTVDIALTALLKRGPSRIGLTGAAQVECLLAEVATRLRGSHAASAGRPVLVTVGGRPAYPHRRDPASRILPCPRRHDWRRLLHELHETHAGMAFGAIRDGDADVGDFFPSYSDIHVSEATTVWRHLGTDAYARSGAFDARLFAVDLGLFDPDAKHLPFPVFVSERDH